MRCESFSKVSARFCLHLSCLSIAEEFRGKDNISRGIIATFMREAFSQGGVCTTVGNFTAFERFFNSQFPDYTQLEDCVKYEDIDLTLSDGEKPFKSLAHLGGIKYFSLYNHSKLNHEI